MKHLLTELLDIDYSVFQAPMAWALKSPDFVAQVSNFGMLGSIASDYLSLQQVDSFINKVQALTTAPFSVNIFVDYDDYGQDSLAKPQEIVQIETSLGLADENSFIIPPTPDMGDLVALLDNQTC